MGLDNAGKTTLVNTYFGIKEDSAPTFGYRTHNVEHDGWRMNVVDVGGQYCFREFWQNYFEKVDGVVLVVDTTDRRGFCEYLDELLRLNVPICLMANKIDLNREFDMQILEKLETTNLKVFGTRADDRKSIDDGMKWLLSVISHS